MRERSKAGTLILARTPQGVEVKVYPSKTLFFRQAIAEGKYADTTVEVSSVIPDGSVLVRFGDDEGWYAFEPKALVEAAWALRETFREEASNA